VPCAGTEPAARTRQTELAVKLAASQQRPIAGTVQFQLCRRTPTMFSSSLRCAFLRKQGDGACLGLPASKTSMVFASGFLAGMISPDRVRAFAPRGHHSRACFQPAPVMMLLPFLRRDERLRNIWLMIMHRTPPMGTGRSALQAILSIYSRTPLQHATAKSKTLKIVEIRVE